MDQYPMLMWKQGDDTVEITVLSPAEQAEKESQGYVTVRGAITPEPVVQQPVAPVSAEPKPQTPERPPLRQVAPRATDTHKKK